jgi:hypothetical protein
MASELRKKYSHGNSAVASIFADGAPAIDWSDTHLEAVLISIVCQLSHHHEHEVGSCSELGPQSRHGDAINLGKSRTKRIDELRGALNSRLQQLTSAFLVVDGVDQCGCFTAFCLEDIILDLHKQHPHFRILLTSRTMVLYDDDYGRCESTNHQPDPRIHFSGESDVEERYQLGHPTYWSTADICDLWSVDT